MLASAFNVCTNSHLVSKLVTKFLYLADIKYLSITPNGYKISISIVPILNLIIVSIESKFLHYHGLSLLYPLVLISHTLNAYISASVILLPLLLLLFGSYFSENKLLHKEDSIKLTITIFIFLNIENIMPIHSEHSVFLVLFLILTEFHYANDPYLSPCPDLYYS